MIFAFSFSVSIRGFGHLCPLVWGPLGDKRKTQAFETLFHLDSKHAHRSAVSRCPLGPSCTIAPGFFPGCSFLSFRSAFLDEVQSIVQGEAEL